MDINNFSKNESSWTVIYTFHKECLHYDHLVKSNPQAYNMICNISNNYTKKYAWRNSDKLIREWLKNNITKIQTNNIAILEWDTLITKKMPETMEIDGVYAKYIRHYEKYPNWYWFKDKPKLNHLSKYACGLLSFGFLLLNIKAAECIIDKQFDFLYEEDIFCELRLGTIFNYSNIPMTEIVFPNILEGQKKITVSDKGDYYHPVKYKINLC
jgi:hypothetical protein